MASSWDVIQANRAKLAIFVHIVFDFFDWSGLVWWTEKIADVHGSGDASVVFSALVAFVFSFYMVLEWGFLVGALWDYRRPQLNRWRYIFAKLTGITMCLDFVQIILIMIVDLGLDTGTKDGVRVYQVLTTLFNSLVHIIMAGVQISTFHCSFAKKFPWADDPDKAAQLE